MCVLYGALTYPESRSNTARPSAFPFLVPCWAPVFILPSRIPLAIFTISSALFDIIGNIFFDSFISFFFYCYFFYLQVVQVLGRSHHRRIGRRRRWWAAIAADGLELSAGRAAAVNDSVLGHGRRVFAPLGRVDGGRRRSDNQSRSHCRFRFRPLGGVLDVPDRPQRRVRCRTIRKECRRQSRIDSRSFSLLVAVTTPKVVIPQWIRSASCCRCRRRRSKRRRRCKPFQSRRSAGREHLRKI